MKKFGRVTKKERLRNYGKNTHHQAYQQRAKQKKQRELWKEHLEQSKTNRRRSALKKRKKEMISTADNDHQHCKEWVWYNLLSKMVTRCNGKWKSAKGKEIGAKEKKQRCFMQVKGLEIGPSRFEIPAQGWVSGSKSGRVYS